MQPIVHHYIRQDQIQQVNIQRRKYFQSAFQKQGCWEKKLLVTGAQIGKGIRAVPSALEAIDIYTLLAHVSGEIAIRLRGFWG